MKNLYELLGVAKTATVQEIKKAYKKLAMKYHPDRTQGDKEKEEIFKQIQEAHEILTDPQRRLMYDETGRTTKQPKGVTVEDRAAEMIVAILKERMEETDYRRMDHMESIKNKIFVAKRQCEANIAELEEDIEDAKYILDNMKAPDSIKENYFKVTEVLQHKINHAKEAITVFDKSVELIKEMSYTGEEEKDPEPEVTWNGWTRGPGLYGGPTA